MRSVVEHFIVRTRHEVLAPWLRQVHIQLSLLYSRPVEIVIVVEVVIEDNARFLNGLAPVLLVLTASCISFRLFAIVKTLIDDQAIFDH